MKLTTYYMLQNRITKKLIALPRNFRTAREAADYALIHDLHAEPVPVDDVDRANVALASATLKIGPL